MHTCPRLPEAFSPFKVPQGSEAEATVVSFLTSLSGYVQPLSNHA